MYVLTCDLVKGIRERAASQTEKIEMNGGGKRRGLCSLGLACCLLLLHGCHSKLTYRGRRGRSSGKAAVSYVTWNCTSDKVVVVGRRRPRRHTVCRSLALLRGNLEKNKKA